MMTTTIPPVPTAEPRRSALDRDLAMRLAATEYDRIATALRELSPPDWSRRTACPAWDVHAMACHVLGLGEMAASPLETMRQLRAANRAGGLFIDALTDLQTRKHLHRSPDELVAMLTAIGPKATRGRRRTPALARRLTRADQPVDETGAHTEPWTLGYLLDVIITRDTWMHRCDIAIATDREIELSAEHDGVLVADVAAEWASRHGRPCTLTLTGPAGGNWTFGGGGRAIESDAVAFCRVLSGRGVGSGLLATRVPF
jgi:uncharacterized protein (TIGR03083 family)